MSFDRVPLLLVVRPRSLPDCRILTAKIAARMIQLPCNRLSAACCCGLGAAIDAVAPDVFLAAVRCFAHTTLHSVRTLLSECAGIAGSTGRASIQFNAADTAGL